MKVVNSGSFRLDVDDERLILCVEGEFFGDTAFRFYREEHVLARDGKTVCKIDQHTYLTAEESFAGPFIPKNSILTVWSGGHKEQLYFSQSHELVTDLAERINAYLRGASAADLKAGLVSTWRPVATLPTEPLADPVPTPSFASLVWNYTGAFGIVALVFSLFFLLVALGAASAEARMPMLLVSAPFLGVGIFFTRNGLKQARRDESIYAHQVRLELPIVAMEISYGGGSNNRNAVEFQYQDANGQIYHRRSQIISRGEVKRWEIGDIADVIVDRTDPGASRLVTTRPVRKAAAAAALA